MTITFLPVDMNAQYNSARLGPNPRMAIQQLLKKAADEQNTRIIKVTATCMATFFTGMCILSRLLPNPAITFSISLISSLAIAILLEKSLKPELFEITVPVAALPLPE
ncbi:MAG: hypothetical protein LLF94_09855 [Chlamydiales bacterium]|nr:hypothetical protein [Chlamydiales bacterium]